MIMYCTDTREIDSASISDSHSNTAEQLQLNEVKKIKLDPGSYTIIMR